VQTPKCWRSAEQGPDPRYLPRFEASPILARAEVNRSGGFATRRSPGFRSFFNLLANRLLLPTRSLEACPPGCVSPPLRRPAMNFFFSYSFQSDFPPTAREPPFLPKKVYLTACSCREHLRIHLVVTAGWIYCRNPRPHCFGPIDTSQLKHVNRL